MASLRFCLFGHSFPAHADTFIKAHEECVKSLPECCSLTIHGYSGLTFTKIFRRPSRYLIPLSRCNFDVILVDLGTNALCDHEVTPGQLVDKVVQFVNMLDQFNVKPKCIVFLSVIQRTKISRPGQVKVAKFNHRVRRYNSLLATRLESMFPKVQLLPQRKINFPKYILDGCHLTEEGLQKYVSNVIHICLRVKALIDEEKL